MLTAAWWKRHHHSAVAAAAGVSTLPLACFAAGVRFPPLAGARETAGDDVRASVATASSSAARASVDR